MTGSFDAKLARELEQEGDKLIEFLRDATNSKKRYTVQCPKSCCRGANFSAEFPDYRTMLEVAKWVAERAEGRPGQQPPPKTAPRFDAGSSELSDEELAARIAALREEVHDGEADSEAA